MCLRPQAKQLLISESHDISNRCIPCRGKPDTHDTYASRTIPRTLPTDSPHTWQPVILTHQSWTDSLLPRKSAPDSTSQPDFPLMAPPSLKLTFSSINQTSKYMCIPTTVEWSPHHLASTETYNYT
jgi:hypothetical protein